MTSRGLSSNTYQNYTYIRCHVLPGKVCGNHPSFLPPHVPACSKTFGSISQMISEMLLKSQTRTQKERKPKQSSSFPISEKISIYGPSAWRVYENNQHFSARHTKVYKIGQLRMAIFSAFYKILQINLAIALILVCSFKPWWIISFSIPISKSKAQNHGQLKNWDQNWNLKCVKCVYVKLFDRL